MSEVKARTEDDTKWFALKVFYNKVFEMEAFLEGRAIRSYIPVQKEKVQGEKHLRLLRQFREQGGWLEDARYCYEAPCFYKRVPVISSLMFVQTSEDELKRLKEDPFFYGKAMIYMTADRSGPAAIPPRQLAAFRLVVESGESGLSFYSDDAITRYREGLHVRVTDGPLKGAEGYIKRIKRDRRLLVSVEGVIAVATSYIPPENLEVID